jgi:hypothetical protein
VSATRVSGSLAVPGTVALGAFNCDPGIGGQAPQDVGCLVVLPCVDGLDEAAEQHLLMSVGLCHDYEDSAEHHSSPLYWVSVFLITTLLLYNISCKRQEVFAKNLVFSQVFVCSAFRTSCPVHVFVGVPSAPEGIVWRCSALVPAFGSGIGLLAHALQ